MAEQHPPVWQTAEEVTFQAWLASGELEEVLEPELPICDPVSRQNRFAAASVSSGARRAVVV